MAGAHYQYFSGGGLSTLYRHIYAETADAVRIFGDFSYYAHIILPEFSKLKPANTRFLPMACVNALATGADGEMPAAL